MKINSVTPAPASRVGDGGYAMFVVSHRPFEHTPTSTLLAMNRQYMREYRADPTDVNRRAVERSSIELSRRGA